VTPEGARDIYVEVYGNVDGFETPMAFHLKYKPGNCLQAAAR
jgi:hypothetical protein